MVQLAFGEGHSAHAVLEMVGGMKNQAERY